MALLCGPLTGESGRPGQLLQGVARHPLRWLSPKRLRGWSRRTILFTVMQSLDSSLQFRPRGRSGRLNTVAGDNAPSRQVPIANSIAQLAAKHTRGYPQTSLGETLRGAPTSAHLLGGAVIGADTHSGVVDRQRRAFGYRNMLITDGSTMPAYVGVNPSLTILAMAEEAMTHVEPRAEGFG
jgi:cholesterol oxidase